MDLRISNVDNKEGRILTRITRYIECVSYVLNYVHVIVRSHSGIRATVHFDVVPPKLTGEASSHWRCICTTRSVSLQGCQGCWPPLLPIISWAIKVRWLTHLHFCSFKFLFVLPSRAPLCIRFVEDVMRGCIFFIVLNKRLLRDCRTDGAEAFRNNATYGECD